jgi:hypothetical protein
VKRCPGCGKPLRGQRTYSLYGANRCAGCTSTALSVSKFIARKKSQKSAGVDLRSYTKEYVVQVELEKG